MWVWLGAGVIWLGVIWLAAGVIWLGAIWLGVGVIWLWLGSSVEECAGAPKRECLPSCGSWCGSWCGWSWLW